MLAGEISGNLSRENACSDARDTQFWGLGRPCRNSKTDLSLRGQACVTGTCHEGWVSYECDPSSNGKSNSRDRDHSGFRKGDDET